MAVTGRQVTVGASAVDLYDAAGVGTPQGGEAFILNQAAASVFLGGPGVATGTGYELKVGSAPLKVTVGQNEQLFAIAAGAGNRVDVLIFQNV